mmetsp:Transcript_38115/g.84931  ORF Transcript_38115/g.84931 Transcript_38115/m.84931 type:complete len:257 (+) Transcript_38115:1203-1973(+)
MLQQQEGLRPPLLMALRMPSPSPCTLLYPLFLAAVHTLYHQQLHNQALQQQGGPAYPVASPSASHHWEHFNPVLNPQEPAPGRRRLAAQAPWQQQRLPLPLLPSSYCSSHFLKSFSSSSCSSYKQPCRCSIRSRTCLPWQRSSLCCSKSFKHSRRHRHRRCSHRLHSSRLRLSSKQQRPAAPLLTLQSGAAAGLRPRVHGAHGLMAGKRGLELMVLLQERKVMGRRLVQPSLVLAQQAPGTRVPVQTVRLPKPYIS